MDVDEPASDKPESDSDDELDDPDKDEEDSDEVEFDSVELMFPAPSNRLTDVSFEAVRWTDTTWGKWSPFHNRDPAKLQRGS